MRWLLLVNAMALAVAAAWLASLALPASRAIRVRNAFLLRRGRAEDFEWTPATIPHSFRQEHAAPPASIAGAVAESGIALIEGDWPRARALVGMLVRHARADAPIRADLETTFEGIVAGGGYCADYVRVYLAAAHGSDLFCRQWGFSFDGFGGHGHTVVEVWDSARGCWAMLDVHSNVFATRPGDDLPLDVAAVRAALVSAPETLEFKRAAEGRLGYPHADKLLAYYRRGAHEWYLWFGNDVVTRERGGIGGFLAALSGRVAHRVASATGRLPSIVVPVSSANQHVVERMEALRIKVRTAAVLALGLGALLAAQQVLAHA